MANQQGKRKRCSECEGEVIITAGGEGTLQCCGKEMQ